MLAKRGRGARANGVVAPPSAGPARAGDLTEAVPLADAARLLGVTVRTVQNYIANSINLMGVRAEEIKKSLQQMETKKRGMME